VGMTTTHDSGDEIPSQLGGAEEASARLTKAERRCTGRKSPVVSGVTMSGCPINKVAKRRPVTAS
jgi:hypothetical protein